MTRILGLWLRDDEIESLEAMVKSYLETARRHAFQTGKPHKAEALALKLLGLVKNKKGKQLGKRK